jgi:hypothetical protein
MVALLLKYVDFGHFYALLYFFLDFSDFDSILFGNSTSSIYFEYLANIALSFVFLVTVIRFCEVVHDLEWRNESIFFNHNSELRCKLLALHLFRRFVIRFNNRIFRSFLFSQRMRVGQVIY